MRTALRAIALLVAVMAAAIVLAVAVVRLPSIQRWVGAQVAARLPEGASVERAALTLLPPGIALTNVTLAADGPTIASVSCHLRVPPLLEGRAELSSVVINRASLTFVRDGSGSVKTAGPLSGLLAAANQDGADAGLAPFLDALPAVQVEDATITFVDQVSRGGTQTLRFDGVKVGLTAADGGGVAFTLAARLEPAGTINGGGTVREVVGPQGAVADHAVDAKLGAVGLDANTIVSYLAAAVPGGGTARAQGEVNGSLTLSGSLSNLTGDASLGQPSGSLLWDEVSLAAPLTLTAQLNATAGELVLSDGQLNIAHLAAARIAASEVAVEFAVDHAVLRIAAARASAYGGLWTQTGTVTLSDPPRFDVQMSANNVDCEDLIAAATGERPEFGCDRFQLNAAMSGVWTGAEHVARQAAGSGRIEMHGGTIPSSSIIAAMWHAMVPLLSPRDAPTRLGAPTRVDRMTESFTLRNGRMDTDDLRLVTDDYTVTGSGTVTLDGGLDLDTSVAMTPSGVAKLLVMAELPVPDEVPNLPAIPTRIRGTVGSPIIVPAVTRIPFAALQGVFHGLTGAGKAVTENADKGLRGLGRELRKIW